MSAEGNNTLKPVDGLRPETDFDQKASQEEQNGTNYIFANEELRVGRNYIVARWLYNTIRKGTNDRGLYAMVFDKNLKILTQAKKDTIGKGNPRGSVWRKFQLCSSFQ